MNINSYILSRRITSKTHYIIKNYFSIKATANQGRHYENELYKKLIDIFGYSNVMREKTISDFLHSFYPLIPKTHLKGIDFIINTTNNNTKTLFVIQLKIGAKKRTIEHVKPFIRTLDILKNISDTNNNYCYQSKIVPFWLSSAPIHNDALNLLKNNYINCFITPSWSINLNNCLLYNGFIDKIKKLKN